ncbi:MAG: histidinol-phosphate transaminase [Pseudomonadota bacterium]
MTVPSPSGPQPKPWISAISAYSPGKSRLGQGMTPVKLSSNENPLGACAAAIASLSSDATAKAARYPDPDATELRMAVGALHDLPVAQIVCGTGSDELLNLAAQGYAGPGDEIIHVRYGFAVYDIATRRIGAVPVIAPDKDYGTDIDTVLACVSDKTRVIYLANPNNPTGTIIADSEIARLHAALPDTVLLVLDQAYGEYLEPAAGSDPFSLARAHDNVLITRTFSKIYGLAAQRIGWAFGAPGLIDTINRIRAPFNVTSSGQAAALAALGDQDFVTRSREHNARWRQWLVNELATLGNYGLEAIPSHANFLLVRFGGGLTAESAYHGLAAAGYIARWLPGQGLPDCLRISIGTEAEMHGMMRALRALCDNGAAS